MSTPPSSLGDALRGRYTLERELGRGGMATVYLAQDLRYRRSVAIKVLHPELAPALGADRFLREIAIVAQLQHPHILPLLDSGEAEGLLYYVMPYVPGKSLRHRLVQEGQLPLDDMLRIAAQIASALAYAHEHGVVHRDLKPENILLEGDQAVLADFGIARALSAAGGESLTRTGLALGTPVYMSPEQAAGDRHLDGRSDIYSLGCVLYEMLAGEPPFTGPTVQALMARHSLDQVPPIRTVRNTVPEAVEQVVLQALAKAPADRYATAQQLAEALATASRAQIATPAPPRKSRLSAGPLGFAVGAVVVGIGAWWIADHISAGRRHPDSPATVSSAPGRVAVLSFANLSSDTTDAYLAQGMSEEIAARLGDFSDVNVASRSAVGRLERADTAELSDHARALGLRYLVEGSVRRAGARVRVSVRLVNASDGFRTWSQSYDRAAMDLLDLQDDIAVDVARAVAGHLVPTDTAARARATRNPDAYDRLLQGNYYLAQRSPRGVARAIESYSEAARLDTMFALAHARRAYAYGVMLDWGWSYQGLPAESLLSRGWDASEQAMQLDTTMADVWQARGALLRFRNPQTFAGVREAHQRSVDLDPRNADAHVSYAVTLRFLGDGDSAAVRLQQALAIEPDRPLALLHLAWIDMARRRFQDARRWLDSATAVDPGFYQAYAERAALRMVSGDTAGARADAETAVRLRPQAEVLAGENVLVALNRRGGDTAGARARLIRLRAYAPRPDTMGVHQTAAWAALLVAAGEDRQAIDFLERVPVPTAHLRIHLEEVHFDAIRSQPPFQRLVAGMSVQEPR